MRGRRGDREVEKERLGGGGGMRRTSPRGVREDGVLKTETTAETQT